MRRLAALVLTLLVVIASIFPTILARETNADRLRRGYPPLPPSRRDTAKRSGPSVVPPPQPVCGAVEVRDQPGIHRLGFVENNAALIPVITVLSPNAPSSGRLHVCFTLSTHTLAPTDLVFTPPLKSPVIPPWFLGSPWPDPHHPDPPPQEEPLTIVGDTPGAHIWYLDPNTLELTITLPGPTPAGFAWCQSLMELKITTVWPPPNQDPVVRFFLTPGQ